MAAENGDLGKVYIRNKSTMLYIDIGKRNCCDAYSIVVAVVFVIRALGGCFLRCVYLGSGLWYAFKEITESS